MAANEPPTTRQRACDHQAHVEHGEGLYRVGKAVGLRTVTSYGAWPTILAGKRPGDGVHGEEGSGQDATEVTLPTIAQAWVAEGKRTAHSGGLPAMRM